MEVSFDKVYNDDNVLVWRGLGSLIEVHVHVFWRAMEGLASAELPVMNDFHANLCCILVKMLRSVYRKCQWMRSGRSFTVDFQLSVFFPVCI